MFLQWHHHRNPFPVTKNHNDADIHKNINKLLVISKTQNKQSSEKRIWWNTTSEFRNMITTNFNDESTGTNPGTWKPWNINYSTICNVKSFFIEGHFPILRLAVRRAAGRAGKKREQTKRNKAKCRTADSLRLTRDSCAYSMILRSVPCLRKLGCSRSNTCLRSLVCSIKVLLNFCMISSEKSARISYKLQSGYTLSISSLIVIFLFSNIATCSLVPASRTVWLKIKRLNGDSS